MKSSRSRSLKSAAALAALIALGSSATAQIRFSSVTVEAEAANALARRALQPHLNAAFAGQTGPRAGQRLVVRITTVMLTANPSGGFARSGRLGAGSDERDYLEGTAFVVGPAGRVISRTPLLVSQQGSSGGAWYLPDNELRRLDALGQQYAMWLRRKIAD